MLVVERYHLATQLLEQARALLGAEHGVTLLVHGPPGETALIVAMQTTLGSRAQARAVIAHAMFECVVAEDAGPADIETLCERDLEALLGR